MSPLGFAVAAALGNVLGAVAVVRHLRRGLRFIDACLAFGAGFMMAVTMLGVLPEVLGESSDAALYVLAGYLAVHLAQHVFTPHFHFGEETHRVSAATGNSALLGLMLHTFFDGVAIASGFLISNRLGVLLFLAVLLHKLPEGVTIASVMVAGGGSRAHAIGAA
ncbi:MAG TPA: ZIP family metal transporter, partial [Gemmatimonadales bacterium]|nr:ZIP family metal transporter [Gemmatimonadales bacterium]